MTPFLWCAVAGCGILLLAMLMDGLTDGLDDLFFDGSLPVIAAALGAFGATGAIVESVADAGIPTAVLYGVPAVTAVLVGFLARWVWVRFRRSVPRNAVPMTPGELVGSQVQVLWWRNGRGEVVARARGHQATLPARSEDALRSGTDAVVLDAEDGTLIVTSLQILP